MHPLPLSIVIQCLTWGCSSSQSLAWQQWIWPPRGQIIMSIYHNQSVHPSTWIINPARMSGESTTLSSFLQNFQNTLKAAGKGLCHAAFSVVSVGATVYSRLHVLYILLKNVTMCQAYKADACIADNAKDELSTFQWCYQSTCIQVLKNQEYEFSNWNTCICFCHFLFPVFIAFSESWRRWRKAISLTKKSAADMIRWS